MNQDRRDQVSTSEVIHDRVTEAYYGKMGETFMKQTQKRVNWMCNQVKGKLVLDVGCSQGIVPILLAREGFEVVGVDISERAVNEARRFVEEEPDMVRDKIKLINEDFMSLKYSLSRPDTIILGEILEHLLHPENFIAKAATLLSQDGILVVTVPFGINDFIDHKQSFYLSKPYLMVSKYFRNVEVEILENWLGITASNKHKKPVDNDNENKLVLLKVLERAFSDIEIGLRNQLKNKSESLHNANLKYRSVTSQYSELKTKFQESRGLNESLSKQLGQINDEIASLREDIQSRVMEIEDLTKQREEGLKSRQILEDQLDKEKDNNQLLKKDNKSLISQNKKYENTLDKRTELLRKHESEAAISNARIIELENQVKNVHERANLLVKNERVAVESLKLVQESANAKEQDLRSYIVKYNEVLAQNIILEEGRQQLIVSQKKLQEELKSSLSKESTLNNKLDTHNKKVQELNLKIELLNEQKEGLKSIIKELKSNHKEIVTQHRTNANELKRYINGNKKLQLQIGSLKKELSSLKQEYKKQGRKLDKSQITISEQEVKYGKIQTGLRNREDEIKHLKDHLKKSQDDLKKAADENSVLSVQSELYLQKIETLSDSLKTIRVRVKGLQKDLLKKEDRYLASIGDFKQQLESNRTELKTALHSNYGLRAKLDQSNEKYRQLTGIEIPKLKDQNNQLQADYNTERRKNQKAQLESAGLKLKLERGERQLEVLKSSIKFRLGDVVVNGFTSFKGFLKLPVLLPVVFLSGLRKMLEINKTPKKSVTQKAIDRKVIKRDNEFIPPARLNVPESIFKKSDNTNYRVACIMDDFSYNSFKEECHLQQLSPGDWKEELKNFNPELIFVESAWRGKDDLWKDKVAHRGDELRQLVLYARNRKIPTIFWNKEDPIHFQTFINTAQLFDFVFTTDFDCVQRYKGRLGHERVFCLPFACQPILNNPIETYKRKNAVSFAGAYYTRYPERAANLESLMNVLPELYDVDIYDRNFGKTDTAYQFPEKFQPYIVGSLPYDQINQAYKGYDYSVNMNSIKRSQTMFARRVFELMASGTLTISNYSKGTRLLFGDLLISTDDENELRSKISIWSEKKDYTDKVRLAALRKVLTEHTYRHRIKYIDSIVKKTRYDPSSLIPEILVVSPVRNVNEAKIVLENFNRQTQLRKKLLLVEFHTEAKKYSKNITKIVWEDAGNIRIKEIIESESLVAFFHPKDYYGRNYLLDLSLATLFSDAPVIGKGTYYSNKSGTLGVNNSGKSYRAMENFHLRRSALKAADIADETVKSMINRLQRNVFVKKTGLSIDRFNYCQNGWNLNDPKLLSQVVDIEGLDDGLSLKRVQDYTEAIMADDNAIEERTFPMERLKKYFGSLKSAEVSLKFIKNTIEIYSQLLDGKHEYVYAKETLLPSEIESDGEYKFFLDSTPGLSINLVLIYVNSDHQRIGHQIFASNTNIVADLPEATSSVRIGFRIYSGGKCQINNLVLGHRDLSPTILLGKSKYLLITNNYPEYNDLYRNAFVHSRVKGYKKNGVIVDVFKLRENRPLRYYEFQDVDVTEGSEQALNKILSTGRYTHILIHFMDQKIWDIVRPFLGSVSVNTWIHGSDIQIWKRRKSMYANDEEIRLAKLQSEERALFWQHVLVPMPKNLKLIFVSRYLAESSMRDLQIELPPDSYEVIPNPIDMELFKYVEKGQDQRKRVLSIRPFSSRIYANDLTVKVIEGLSTKPFFSQLEFRIIGRGKLFEETVKPLRKYKNVILEEKFLTQQEIARLHKSYGIFLCPSRMDTQGVSRDEAMSSGLVPVTNAVGAIPEFIDETCAIIAPNEETEKLISGISEIIENPELFQQMSKMAHKRVEKNASSERVISTELSLFAY